MPTSFKKNQIDLLHIYIVYIKQGMNKILTNNWAFKMSNQSHIYQSSSSFFSSSLEIYLTHETNAWYGKWWRTIFHLIFKSDIWRFDQMQKPQFECDNISGVMCLWMSRKCDSIEYYVYIRGTHNDIRSQLRGDS